MAQADLANGPVYTKLAQGMQEAELLFVREMLDEDVYLQLYLKKHSLLLLPLFLAVSCGDKALIQELLDKNPSIELKNNFGVSLLCMAIMKHRHIDIVANLLEKGISIVCEHQGDQLSILIAAIFYGNLDSIPILLPEHKK